MNLIYTDDSYSWNIRWVEFRLKAKDKPTRIGKWNTKQKNYTYLPNHLLAPENVKKEVKRLINDNDLTELDTHYKENFAHRVKYLFK